MGTGDVSRIACDNVVFAVGDRVDESVGLPYRDGLYVTSPDDQANPGAAYEVWDPERQQPVPLTFVVGWARRASDGVVGRARLDAETGAKHVLSRLAARPPRSRAEADRLVESVIELVRSRGGTPVTYEDVQVIEAHERARAASSHAPEFKFGTDREMLDLLRG